MVFVSRIETGNEDGTVFLLVVEYENENVLVCVRQNDSENKDLMLLV